MSPLMAKADIGKFFPSAMLRMSCAFVPETAMRRREFIALLGGMAFALPTVTRAQQVERVRKISVLMPLTESDPEGRARLAALQQGLERHGWSEGRNIKTSYRWFGS